MPRVARCLDCNTSLPMYNGYLHEVQLCFPCTVKRFCDHASIEHSPFSQIDNRIVCSHPNAKDIRCDIEHCPKKI